MKNSEIREIKIYNTKGILLKNFSGVQQFDLSKLNTGLYIIVFSYSGNKTKRQLIKV